MFDCAHEMSLEEYADQERQRIIALRHRPFSVNSRYRTYAKRRPPIVSFAPMLHDEVECAYRHGWNGQSELDVIELTRMLELDGMLDSTIVVEAGFI